MVPIRDAGLIGRKIDCPKCKYRFVVEEPADEDEAPAKKADKAASGKNGKGGPRKAEPAAKPAAKKKGTSPVLIIGGGLAVVALVAIVIALVAMSSGGKTDTPAGGGGGGGGGSGQTEGEGEKEKEKDKPPPVAAPLVNISNLLPNDTHGVISYPMTRTTSSALRAIAMDDGGAYRGSRLPEQLGIDDLSDLNRVITAINTKADGSNNWVFTILQTKSGKPVNDKVIKDRLQLAPAEKVKSKTGKEYETFLVKTDLDSLGALLLRANQPKDQFAVHFLDTNTVVFADPAPLAKFLEEDGKPDYLTKPESSGSGTGGTGGTGQPGAGQIGTPMPGGMAGGPPMAGGATGSAMPPGKGPMMNGPPMAGGGAGMYGGMGYMGGQQRPGGAGNDDSMPVEPSAPPSYLSISSNLKYVLDHVEKVETNRETKKKDLVSILTAAGDVQAFQSGLAPWLAGQGLIELEDTQKLAVGLVLRGLKTLAVSVNEFNQDKLEVILAGEGRTKTTTEAFDKFLRPLVTEALVANIKKQLDLKVTVKQPTTTPRPGGGPTTPGIPGYPGMPTPMPGGGMTGGGFRPPPAGGGGGSTAGDDLPGAGGAGGTGAGFPGTGGGYPGQGTKPPDEKSDGTITPSVTDKLFVYEAELNLGASDKAYNTVAAATRETLHRLRAQGEMAISRPRYHDLAAAMAAYVKEKGSFPRGALDRNSAGRALPWRPDQRLSFYAALLPYGAPEYAEWRLDANQGWNEGTNATLARRMVPMLQVPGQPELSPAFVVYPGTDDAFGATHFVGVAGVGFDIPYGADDAQARKRGVFGFDRITRKSEITDGPEQTIALILVPGDIKAPWLAGGGATVRAVPDAEEDPRPLTGFVCITFPANPEKKTRFDGQRGTLAIMADGKVRFIPESLPADTFRALCTIAGGDKVEKLDELCPVIIDESSRELKTPPGAPVTGGKPKTDQEAIQGNWVLTTMTKNGEALPAALLKSFTFSVSGSTVTMSAAGRTQKATFTLDPSKSPKTIDSVDLDGPDKGKKALGIYELTPKQFKICFADDGVTTRPTSYTSTPENKQTVIVLDRASGPSAPINSAWKTFSPASKAFSASMPGDASEIKKPLPDGSTALAYASITDKGVFSVAIINLPAQAAQLGADKLLDSVKENLARQSGAKVTSESPIKLGAIPGREYTISMGDKGTVKSRVYISGSKLFELNVAPVTSATEKDVKTFFDSFKIGS